MSKPLPPELADALTTEEQRKKYSRFVDLVRILGECIITNDYTIPDGLSRSIRLTPYGDAALTKVATARTDKIPAKEARLMCALAVGHEQLLIDIDATDVDGMAEAISEQIVSGDVRFPFPYGREAYDTYAAMFEEAEPVLTYDETQRFLDATPPGVNQYGRYVTGPYGLLVSRTARRLSAGRRVDAFHCSDPLCDIVHSVHLATSAQAPINAMREKFEDSLPNRDAKPVDWFGAADDIRDIDAIMFSDSAVGVVATLLGDALSLPELRAFVVYLLDETGGELRTMISPFLHVADATIAVENLTRAELLQISLLMPELTLQQTLDALVDDHKIEIPSADVRRPVLNSERRSGAFGLSPELGVLGVRFVSDQPGFAVLRLRDELTKLFDLTDDAQRTDLKWRLRSIEADSLEEQLDTFFRTENPGECLRRIGLATRESMAQLAKNLKLRHGLEESDEQICRRMLWKLGFPVAHEDDPRAEFWRLHEKLLGLARGSSAPGARDTEEFLGVASKFFRELERFLQESLAFAAWALLHDHVADAHAYRFGLEADNARGLELVQESVQFGGDTRNSYDFLSGKLDIYTTGRGFEFLSARLASFTQEDVYDRPDEDIPAFARGSRLKLFPFKSQIPFLWLTKESQDGLIIGLKGVSQALQRGRVSDVRNEHQHYRKSSAGVTQIETALHEVEIAARSLEAMGFSLVESRLEDAVHDRWGRSEFYFSAPRGARHVIPRPSNYDWLGLPDLDAAHYIVRGAVFAQPNEVLRFQRRLDSEFAELWQDIPARRRPRGSALSQNSVEHRTSEVRSS